MILSDRSIREEIALGRIEIDPFDDSCVQPSSVDLHVDARFRTFHNARYPYIDVKKEMPDLTEEVAVDGDQPFILHPGEFVLGSTLERVRIPDDLVARLEGKSSLGRLGLLIHSSLPASETVWVLDEGQLAPRPVGEVVAKQLQAFVVAFDPDTFKVDYHAISGWYEGPADRIYEVVLASGRRVRVTAAHNLFTLDRGGRLVKVRTHELRRGHRVAIPHRIPCPPDATTEIDVLALIPELHYREWTCEGPAVAAAFADHGDTVRRALREEGLEHVDYYRRRGRLPLHVARQVGEVLDRLAAADRLLARGSRSGVPAHLEVDADVAWMLGIYVAEGYRRGKQFTISNTNQRFLDRVETVLRRIELPVYRSAGAITCCSASMSRILGWLGVGDHARNKRVPPTVFGWPTTLIEAFVEGLIDGDGRREAARLSFWTISEALVGDVLLLSSRLGRRAGTTWKTTRKTPICQVYLPTSEHKLYQGASGSEEFGRFERLLSGDLIWDSVVEVRDIGEDEPVFDIEVRPGGRKIENFLAGYGGVFVSNTAGYVDPGWDGYLTLELSNVANLPITIYPGMKIGQISFFRLTTQADRPYGTKGRGKYQGQRGPTASRFFEEFRAAAGDGSGREASRERQAPDPGGGSTPEPRANRSD